MDAVSNNHIKGIIEAILFISEKPVVLEQIKEAVEGVDTRDIREIINILKSEYAQRKSGIAIVEIAGGFQMLTNSDYAMYIKKFYHSRHKEKLSKPALETLAIVAYKQPVTRLDIELIRGVNSDGVMIHLLDKGLVKIVGRKDVPGRPYMYGTTKEFLEYFGLKSLEDLPKLEDFSSLQAAAQEKAEEKQDEPQEAT
jgi:segregation and condensation protein B